MIALHKRIRENSRLLRESGKTLEDLYTIIFAHPEDVFTEDASLVGAARFRTYGQVQAAADRVAAGIAARTGLTGEYIGLYAENKPQWIDLFWGILKSGNKPYLINLRQPTDVSAHALKTLGATVTVSLSGAPDLGTEIWTYDQLISQQETLPKTPFGNEFALSTSGTTLSKKICLYTGESVAEQLINIDFLLKENPRLVKPYQGKLKHLVFLPLYHIFGLQAVFLWYSLWNSTFVFPSDLSPDSLLRTVKQHQVSHIFAVPLLWEALEKGVRKEGEKNPNRKKQLEKALALSLNCQKIFPSLGEAVARRLFRNVRSRLLGDSVRFCISGGSPIKPGTLALINGLGYSLRNGYGMSELGITSVDLSRKVQDRLEGTIGRPFPSVRYRRGEEGQLLAQGTSLCKELIVDGEKIPMPSWFDTGDLVSEAHGGRYRISGRRSDLVFGADGENLNPDLAEQAFSLTEAKNFTVTGDEANETLLLIVQVPSDLSEAKAAALEEEIRRGNESLPVAYRIKSVRYTGDALMRPQDIKVSRALLRRWIQDGTVTLREALLPPKEETGGVDSPIKATLRQMMAEILGIDGKTVSDRGHFMNDLGGSSLDYFTLLGKIDETFGVALEFEAEGFGYCLEDFERIVKERLGE